MKGTTRNQYPIMTQSLYPAQPEPLIDEVSENEIYYGYASMNTSEDAEEWLIVRKTKDGTVTRTEYPNASLEFNQAWSNRTNLTYAR